MPLCIRVILISECSYSETLKSDKKLGQATTESKKQTAQTSSLLKGGKKVRVHFPLQ